MNWSFPSLNVNNIPDELEFSVCTLTPTSTSKLEHIIMKLNQGYWRAQVPRIITAERRALKPFCARSRYYSI